MSSFLRPVVVCGTDTDVGKTAVSAWLVQGLNATYWKPVQSGLDDGGDRGRIQTLLDLPDSRVLKEGYAFQHPVSPHWAAERDGVILDPGTLTLPEVNGPLVVETAGGLMTHIRMFSDYLDDNWPADVPDPYYGEEDGFDQVLDMLEEGCPVILQTLMGEGIFDGMFEE